MCVILLAVKLAAAGCGHASPLSYGQTVYADGSSPLAEYAYDAAGSLVRKIDHVGGTETVYAYNRRNRLESVLEDGQEVASYVYHPEGYRLGKTAGGTAVWYLSDPYNPTGYVQVLEEVGVSLKTHWKNSTFCGNGG